MATISTIATLVAAAHLVVLASPSAAFAQTAPAQAETPSTARLPTTSPTPGTRVLVHLEGSDVAELQEDTVGDHRHWVTVCFAPCDRGLSSEFSYRIAGDGIRNSRVFALHAQSGDREILTIDESSKSAFVGGIVATSLGGTAVIVGSLVFILGSLEAGIQGAFGSQDDSGTETVGLGILVLGVAGIIGGVVAMVSNARTGVTPGRAAPAAAWPTPVGLASDALRGPRRDTPWAAAVPPMTGVPLFSGRF
jgi:hypothetical protein